MMSGRATLRQAPRLYRPLSRRPGQCIRHINANSGPQRGTTRSDKGGGGAKKILAGLAIAVAAGGAVWLYPTAPVEPARRPQAEIEFEKPRPNPESPEDNRDIISSQHLQVKKSWEHPGVYAWGSNVGRVVAPDSAQAVIKTPRRLSFFDGQLLRDLKLDRDFGAAITENGDLVQWGAAFSKENPNPVPTLKGKDLVKMDVTRDRIIALGKNGVVYSLPVAGADQMSGKKPEKSSWLSFWSSHDPVSYRILKPTNLGWGERVTDLASGLEHALLLTNKGRLYSAAASTSDFPSRGQLGVPGLTWSTRPKGPYDQPHEVMGVKGFRIAKIAAGDFHSLALDAAGHVFVFGDNTSGQLGFEPEKEIPYFHAPFPLPFSKIYAGTNQEPCVTSVAAGGANSFFTVDAKRVAGQKEEAGSIPDLGRVTADTWACGNGLYGSLGTGRWTHVSLGPTKIKSLSGLSEWNEKTKSIAPIRLARLSVGSTHAAAVMDNVTSVNAAQGRRPSDNETNWGADVLWWGGNEFYQVGTGRRNNVAVPTYIGPLDGGRGDAEKGRQGEMHRFQITPRTTTRLGQDGKGRKVSLEQRVECGRCVTAVYSGA